MLDLAKGIAPEALKRKSAEDVIAEYYEAIREMRTPKKAGADPIKEPPRNAYSWKQVTGFLHQLETDNKFTCKSSTIVVRFNAITKKRAMQENEAKAKAKKEAKAKSAQAAIDKENAEKEAVVKKGAEKK